MRARIASGSQIVAEVYGISALRPMMSSIAASGRTDSAARPPAVQNAGTLWPTNVAKKVSRLLCILRA